MCIEYSATHEVATDDPVNSPEGVCWDNHSFTDCALRLRMRLQPYYCRNETTLVDAGCHPDDIWHRDTQTHKYTHTHLQTGRHTNNKYCIYRTMVRFNHSVQCTQQQRWSGRMKRQMSGTAFRRLRPLLMCATSFAER